MRQTYYRTWHNYTVASQETGIPVGTKRNASLRDEISLHIPKVIYLRRDKQIANLSSIFYKLFSDRVIYCAIEQSRIYESRNVREAGIRN